jgi:hypothetical protein
MEKARGGEACKLVKAESDGIPVEPMRDLTKKILCVLCELCERKKAFQNAA